MSILYPERRMTNLRQRIRSASALRVVDKTDEQNQPYVEDDYQDSIEANREFPEGFNYYDEVYWQRQNALEKNGEIADGRPKKSNPGVSL